MNAFGSSMMTLPTAGISMTQTTRHALHQSSQRSFVLIEFLGIVSKVDGISSPDDASGHRSCKRPSEPPKFVSIALSSRSERQSMTWNHVSVNTAINVAGPAATIIGALPYSAPIVVPIAITVVLASWVYGMYQRTWVSIMHR
jgi:hypothetical protein